MVYVLFAIVTLLAFQLTSSDNTSLTQQLDHLNFDAAYRVQSYYAELSILCALIATAFVCSSAIRDFRYRTSPVLFSKPIRKVPYLLGRFSASTLVAVLPMLGISLGVVIACAVASDPESRLGGHSWQAHLWGISLFAIPNTFIISTFIFAVSLRIKTIAGAFVAVLSLLFAYLIASVAASGLDNDFLVGMLDPFGFQAFVKTSKYWTVEEKNLNFVGPAGTLLLNRLLWVHALSVGLVCH